MSAPYVECDFVENEDLEGNDDDMALRSILSWGDEEDEDEDDNDRQSSAASMASSNEALGGGGGPTSAPRGQQRGGGAGGASEDDSTSSFLAQLKAEYSGGGGGGSFAGSLQLPFPGPGPGLGAMLQQQQVQQQQVQQQQIPQQQAPQQSQHQQGTGGGRSAQTPQHHAPQHQHQHQPQVIAPAPTSGASSAPAPVAPQSATNVAAGVGYAPIQPQAQPQQVYQPQPQPPPPQGQQPQAPMALPPGMPNFLGAIPLQQQFSMAATDPASFIRQMQAMQQQQQQQAAQQQPGILQQQTLQQQQQPQPQGPPPQQQQQQKQQPVMAAMPQQAQQLPHQHQHIQGTEQRIAPQAPPPIQTPQTPAMVPPTTTTAAPPPTKTRTKQSRRKQTPRSSPPQPVPTTTTANIVSCSDTDGLTTDAESGRPRGVGGGAKTAAVSAHREAASSSPFELAPSPGARRGGKGAEGTGIGLGSAKSKNNQNNHSEDGLTKEERAKANRDRNREHARNTRLRKKAYLEKLKVTVEELCRERDNLVTERAGAANLLVEMHNTRTDVLLSFFALRSAYERRRELWASILDESCFTCVMPVTPYRSFPASEVQVARCQRTILGIDGMMADTASLHVLLNSIVDRSRFPDATIQFRYTLVTEDAVVAGNQMMARWIMTTLNATECGARMEVSKRGMLCCKFNSAHKITGLELMFDVMAFMLQLKQSVGTDSFAVVPNTVQTCQRPFETPMVMTLSERPYTIVQVNKLWEEMTGWRAEDVVGKASCRILQGQETERNNLELLMSSVRYKRPVFTVVTNFTKTGRKFKNFLNVYPLSTDSKITHYVGMTTYAGWADGGGKTASLPEAVQEVIKDGGAGHQVVQTPAGLGRQEGKGSPVGVVSSSNATVASHSSINTHQAVAPRAPQPTSQPQQPQQGGRQPQVVVPGRQDSCNTGGADTVSSLTSSVGSSSSRGSGGSGSNNGNSDPSSNGILPPGGNPVSTSSLPGTAPMDVSRTAVTTGSSSCSSAGGSTSTNSSSSDGPKASSKQKRRKRKSKAGDLTSREKKQKMGASN